MSKNKVGKIVSGVLVGGMLLSGGVALADTNTAPNVKVTQQQNKIAEKNQMFSKVLDQLVKDGTISKGQANQIKSYLDKKIKDKKANHKDFKKLTPEQRKEMHKKWTGQKEKVGLFNDLVKNNIINQKQADALKAKFIENARQMREQKINSGLKTLVDKKTITRDQADKVKEQLKAGQQNKPVHQNPLQELVKNGTITQDQAKAIVQAIFPHRGHKAINK